MPDLHSLHRYRFRTVWISDVHLGFRGCRADFLLDFLRTVETETLYLVGDIVDVWNMKKGKGLFWPQEHNNVIRTILGKAKHGTRVIYIPGNHDEIFREYAGLSFGNLHIRQQDIHTTADGRRLLVLHGDEFDSAVKCGRLLAAIGDRAYDVVLYLNRMVNRVRRRLGWPYWSLAACLKRKVQNAMRYIGNFEQAVVHAAQREGVDGVVCGHIHHAGISTIDGITYCNDGDWVENCTALGERPDGSLHLIHWTDIRRDIIPATAPALDTAGEVRAARAA